MKRNGANRSRDEEGPGRRGAGTRRSRDEEEPGRKEAGVKRSRGTTIDERTA